MEVFGHCWQLFLAFFYLFFSLDESLFFIIRLEGHICYYYYYWRYCYLKLQGFGTFSFSLDLSQKIRGKGYDWSLNADICFVCSQRSSTSHSHLFQGIRVKVISIYLRQLICCDVFKLCLCFWQDIFNIRNFSSLVM